MTQRTTTKLRFSSARQVVEAVPHIQREFEGEALDVDPIEFVQDLVRKGKASKALTLCCYLLSRHDVTRWACWALRSLPVAWSASDQALLAAAESWAIKPSDNSRLAAFRAAKDSGYSTAPAWAAAAAGWAGGNMVESAETTIPPPPYLTGQAVKISFELMALLIAPEKRPVLEHYAVAGALKLLEA